MTPESRDKAVPVFTEALNNKDEWGSANIASGQLHAPVALLPWLKSQTAIG
jgi:hypothetical protein